MEVPVNLDETIGKTVGRRSLGDALDFGMKLQEAAASYRGSWKGLPKGVYRFHSHEEAEAWKIRELTKPRA